MRKNKTKQLNCVYASLASFYKDHDPVYTTQKQLPKKKGQMVNSCGFITEIIVKWAEGYCEENDCLKIPILLPHTCDFAGRSYMGKLETISSILKHPLSNGMNKKIPVSLSF